jgi:hypothetical protein
MYQYKRQFERFKEIELDGEALGEGSRSPGHGPFKGNTNSPPPDPDPDYCEEDEGESPSRRVFSHSNSTHSREGRLRLRDCCMSLRTTVRALASVDVVSCYKVLSTSFII